MRTVGKKSLGDEKENKPLLEYLKYTKKERATGEDGIEDVGSPEKMVLSSLEV